MMSLDGQQSAAHPSEQASKQNSNKYEFFCFCYKCLLGSWSSCLLPEHSQRLMMPGKSARLYLERFGLAVTHWF